MSLSLTELIGMGISLLGVFTGIVTALVKLLLSQVEKRLGERFADVEKDIDRLSSLERDLLQFKGELPLHYVRREDYVRNQSVIEAKLDALYSKLEVIQIRGIKDAN